MPTIAPVWEADAATGSATSATFTATGAFPAGDSVVLVVENANTGAVVDSITGANGDVFALDVTEHAPSSNITFESWRCSHSAGGTNVLYTINFHGATSLNPRYWAQGFNQPLSYVRDGVADATANLVFASTAAAVGILIARNPTAWPPAGYTVVGTAGSAHCAQQVYAASGTETITGNNGGMFAAVYGAATGSVAGAGGVAGTFTAGNPTEPIVSEQGAGSVAGSFTAAGSAGELQPASGPVQAELTVIAPGATTVIPRSGNIAGAFLAGNPIAPTGGTTPGWPTVEDVASLLRLGADAASDPLLATSLAAAIDWVTNRADAQWTTPGAPGFLPDALFTVAQLEAGRLYRRRDSTDGTIGWGDAGVVRVGPKDPDIETMLAPYLALVVA